MARLKPRKGAKRASSSDSGSDAAVSGDVSGQPQQHKHQQQEEVQHYDAEYAVQSMHSSPAPGEVHQTPVPLPRTRTRKRKPVGPAASTTPEPDSAAVESGGRSSKRARRGGSGGRGLYRELDENDFDYTWASSESEEEQADGVGSDDVHESYCAVCGSDANGAKLLCCDSCPKVHHIYCLDPPLSRIPKGMWFCPSCQGVEALLDDKEGLEKILAVRTIPAAAAAAAGTEPKAAAAQPQQQQFYVKWKERSHLHCSWISEPIMTAAAAVRVVGQVNPVAARLRKFWRDQQAAVESGELEEAEETGQLVNGVNPAWLQVDKVLAERVIRDGGVEYLVSWKELPLEQATWERAEDLSEFSAEIASFQASQTPIVAEAAARKREQTAAAKAEKASQEKEAAAAGGAGTDDPAAPGPAADDGMRGSGTRKFESTPDFVQGGALHPYQLEGLNWLYHKAQSKHNAILADEMGLGKTIQAIALMGAFWKDCVRLPHLVVVPLTTLSNWERELATWAPYLRVVSLKGTAAARQLVLDHCLYAPAEGHGRGRAAYQERVKFHVLLTTYELVSKHLSQIQRLDWAALVVDEAHRLKNATSRLFQDLVKVSARHRLLLTGTPLQNNLDELFFLMNFLEPGKFPSVEVFRDTYAALDDKDKVGELHRQLKPHLLRRLKKDVLKQLPPKMEQMVRVEMSDEQREIYKAILSRNYDALVDKSKSVVRLRNVMMELRKTVNHPCLLSFDINTPAYEAAVARRTAAATAAADAAANGADPAVPPASEATEQLVAASGKLALLDKMMVRLKAGGHRVLIYSQFTRTLDVLEDWIAGRAWGYERIDGDVSGMERQKRVDSFNNHPDKKFVFLLSTRAGGLGINLATADTVIIYDSDWNPHNDLQALARAHRMGQKRSVMVFRLVTRGTIEERMLQRAKSKMVLEHLVVAKAAKSDKLAQQELDDILRYGAKELFADDAADEPLAAAAGANPGAADAAAEHGDQKQQQHHSRMRIVYDDAAIERLLDRSQVAAAAAAAAAEEAAGEDDEFTKAFKVANFDMVEQEEEQQQQQTADPQQQQQQVPPPDTDADEAALAYDPAATELHKSQQQFWADILGERPFGDQGKLGLATQQLGQRRARQAARYIFYESDSSGSEEEGAQDSDEQQQQHEGLEVEGSGRKRGRHKKSGDDDDELYQADEQETESEDIVDDADAGALALGDSGAAAAMNQLLIPGLARGASLLPAEADGNDSIAAAAAAAVQQAAAQVEAAVQKEQQQQQQQQQPPPVAGAYPPRVSGSGAMLQICGLSSAERHAFMSVLMHFGPPHIHVQPNLGWAPYTQHIKGKTIKQLEAYLLVFLEHLQDAAADPESTHGRSDFLPHSLFFVGPKGQVHPVKIWERIAVLQLLAQKMWRHGSRPASMFVCGGAGTVVPGPGGKSALAGALYKNLSARPGGWGPAQDYALVRGIFMSGYECWHKVLALTNLEIKQSLRTELGFAVDYDSPAAAAAAEQLVPGTLPPGVTEQQQVQAQALAHSRKVGNCRKKESEWLDKRARAIVNALRVEFAAVMEAEPRVVQQHVAVPMQQTSQPQQQRQQQRNQQPRPAQQLRHMQQGPQLQPQNTLGAQQSQHIQHAGMPQPQPQQRQPGSSVEQRQQRPTSAPIAVSPSWRSEIAQVYKHMQKQLMVIKSQASTAANHDKPDDGRTMKNAAEQFRANVKQLESHAHQLELIMGGLSQWQVAPAVAPAIPAARADTQVQTTPPVAQLRH